MPNALETYTHKILRGFCPTKSPILLITDQFDPMLFGELYLRFGQLFGTEIIVIVPGIGDLVCSVLLRKYTRIKHNWIGEKNLAAA